MAVDAPIRIPTPSDLDIISNVKFSPLQNQLLASSWDGRILLYDCSQPYQTTLLQEFYASSPALSIAHGPGNITYTGHLDGSIRQVDYENGKLTNNEFGTVSNNDNVTKGINNMCQLQRNQPSTLICSSIDGTLQVLDLRKKNPAITQKLGTKIFSMDATTELLAVGMADRRIEIYDHRNWNEPYQIRESGLRYQIQDLKVFPDMTGFAISSIDGRVAIEYFDPSPQVQASKFAFKCHRKPDKQAQIDHVYSINSITFSKLHGTLFTAGSDGHVCLWNWQRRKRMRQYPKLTYNDANNPQSIVKCDLNHQENLLCIATSDDSYKAMSSLALPLPPPNHASQIYLRILKDGECAPKQS